MHFKNTEIKSKGSYRDQLPSPIRIIDAINKRVHHPVTSIHVLLVELMSEDHGTVAQPSERPVFLGVTPGDTVVVFKREKLVDSDYPDWFMATVLFVEGSARNPKAPSLFQVADIDTGTIQFVNADQVEKVMI